MIDMGGYGFYVWPCYVLLLIIIGWLLFATMRNNKSVHAKLKNDQQTET